MQHSWGNSLCMTITVGNTIKVCFSYKKYPDTIQTRMAQIVNSIFLIENLKIIGVQNRLLITFGTALVCNTILNLNQKLYEKSVYRLEICT